MHRASATEAVDTGSIPGWVKPKTIKIGIPASLLDVQQFKGQCEVCGRQMGRWQLDSKTEKSLRCLLAKATWWIKCNYNYIFTFLHEVLLWCWWNFQHHCITNTVLVIASRKLVSQIVLPASSKTSLTYSEQHDNSSDFSFMTKWCCFFSWTPLQSVM